MVAIGAENQWLSCRDLLFQNCGTREMSSDYVLMLHIRQTKCRKIRAVETAKQNKTKKQKQKQNKTKNSQPQWKNLSTFYLLTQQGTLDWLTFRVLLRSNWDHFPYIMHKRQQCYKTKNTSFTWKFCFPNTAHVILSREFSFQWPFLNSRVHKHTQRMKYYYSLENLRVVCVRKTKFKR